MERDVTDQVDFGWSDDEFLPITKCVCGERFGWWEFSISIYENTPTECPKCRRKFFFSTQVTVYEVVDD